MLIEKRQRTTKYAEKGISSVYFEYFVVLKNLLGEVLGFDLPFGLAPRNMAVPE